MYVQLSNAINGAKYGLHIHQVCLTFSEKKKQKPDDCLYVNQNNGKGYNKMSSTTISKNRKYE